MADEPDSDRGRMMPRTDRYNALPDKTRLFIENLHDDDLENLDGVLRLVRGKGVVNIRSMVEAAEAMRTFGRTGKWVIGLAFVLFTSVVTLVAGWNALKASLWPHGGGPQ